MEQPHVINAHDGDGPYITEDQWHLAHTNCSPEATIAVINQLFGIGVVPDPTPRRQPLTPPHGLSHERHPCRPAHTQRRSCATGSGEVAIPGTVVRCRTD
jgi:hypothetical protein